MPYAMLANAIPGNRMGFYMGVFNFFIVLPQIAASLGLGYVMSSLLGGNTMNAVLLGGASMLIAAFCVRFVDDDESLDGAISTDEGEFAD
jgi:maltose/moltooligosaccharide transporter